MRRISVLALALAAVGATPTPTPPGTKTRVDAVFQEYDRSDSPGCALGVFRDGKIVYARGYGMANLELGVANSAQTVFDIGSTSKQFTAFSIHLLARDGKLTLDDDIRKWLPEIPSYGKTVTIRHLLHHTSGLRDYIVMMELQGVQTEDLTTEQDSLDILSKQKAPNFAPGEEHLYSNTGYFLLGVIVKRAAGKSLRDFAADRIFEPLGMRHTQFNDSHTRLIPGRATGYSKAEAGGFGIDMSDWEQVGDGSVLTTVEDLQRWDQNFYEPRVGDAKLLQAMQEVGVLNSGKRLEYASALILSSYRGLPTVSHGGAWAGYRAQLLRFPEQHFSVACLCNLGNANPSRLAYRVSEVYLGASMKPEEPKAGLQSGQARLAIPPKSLRPLVGTYRDPASNEMIRLAVSDDRLTADVEGRNFPLSAIGRNRFRFDNFPEGKREIELATAAGPGRPRLNVVTTHEDNEVERQTFEPVDAWSPSAAELAQLAGSYASEEVGTTWLLAVEDGKLFIRHRGVSKKPLTPTVKDTFTLEGMQLIFQRGLGGTVTGFLVDAGRSKGFGFQRRPAT
jgi:CubicO group peptidase (beta-lactamase class C family)